MSRKRRAYSLKQRYEVVKAARGCSKKPVADQLRLPRASAIKMSENSDKIIKDYENGNNILVKKTKKA